MKQLKKHFALLALVIIPLVFFYPFFIQGKLPIPSDTIIGLYHPFRDLYSENYPNGIPYKNSLITDPVRQQYPWKEFAVNSLKNGKLPIWNPYEMSGKPQLANFQTGVYYPLNILLFISPFYFSWSVFILMQPLIAGIFMYLFLKNLKINTYASVLGGICFSFSGFMIAWLEWGVVGHTYIWLPLILLSIDKGFIKKNIFWKLVYIFSLTFSFFAGHLQVFSYVFIITIIYFILRLLQVNGNRYKMLVSFIFDTILVGLITVIQWLPTLSFINLSNRAYDQTYQNAGWFIPWQNLAMFIAPDFFGNPTTLNYYGVWNYAEFVGYIGIPAIILALYALLFRRDKKTLFFAFLFFAALLFATPNVISKIPFQFSIPFLSTAQPTRLIGIASFALATLVALGLDLFMVKKSKIWVASLIIGIFLVLLFIITQYPVLFPNIQDMFVAQNNLKLPAILFLSSTVILFLIHTFKNKKVFHILVLLLISVTIFDLFRFGWKFTPFTEKSYLFPETKIISFLQKNLNNSRIAVLDDRILPPNFQTVYRIPSISGYDPLYLTNYAKLIAANERFNHSIEPPFGYNRILTPKNYNTQIFDLLSVKYVLSFSEIAHKNYRLALEEGQTKVYENLHVFPYVFFVKNVEQVGNESVLAKRLFEVDLSTTALVRENSLQSNYASGSASILEHSVTKTIIKTESEGEGFLAISEIYYPNVEITIDGDVAEIYEINLALLGIEVPSGKHTIEIIRSLF